MKETVKEFEHLFKKTKDDKDGAIEPEEGIDEEYDRCKRNVEAIQEQFSEILKEERKKFKCNLINYVHTKFFVFIFLT